MRWLLAAPAVAAAVVGLVSFGAVGGSAAPEQRPVDGADLYLAQCAVCHGADGTGIEDRGPALTNEGAAAVDFVLRTGRMPLPQPNMQAERARPLHRRRDRRPRRVRRLLRGRPADPRRRPGARRPRQRRRLYQLNCAACHVASGSGAAIGGGRNAPDLMEATATEIGEAVRVGPGAMPRFATLSDQDVDDVAAYIGDMQNRHTTAPEDFGGVGPVAEGLAAWLLALLPIIALTRWIGRPHEGRDAPVDESAEVSS